MSKIFNRVISISLVFIMIFIDFGFLAPVKAYSETIVEQVESEIQNDEVELISEENKIVEENDETNSIEIEYIMEDNQYVIKPTGDLKLFEEFKKTKENTTSRFFSGRMLNSTYERDNITLSLEQRTVDLFETGKLDWYLDTLNQAVADAQSLLGIKLKNKINITTVENLGVLGYIDENLTLDRDWFEFCISFDYNNEQFSRDLQDIATAVIMNDDDFVKLSMPYPILYLFEAYLIEKGDTQERGNGEYTVYKGSEIINYYQKKYDNSVANGTYNDYGLAYSLLKIKNEVGWEVFEKAFKDLVEFTRTDTEPWKLSYLQRINFILDKVATYSNKDIYNMFTQEELTVYETYYNGKLGGNIEESPVDKESEIIITENTMIKEGSNTYLVNSEINEISGSIKGDFNPTSILYENKIGNLIIQSENLVGNKNWSVQTPKLSEGINTIKISAKDINENSIEKIIIIYNTSDDNANGLVTDKNDDDNDGLPNYMEDILKTDKNDPDTDSDSVSDYDEVFKTFTDPLVKDIFALNEDIDSDGLRLEQELLYNCDPNNADTDYDGLSDYDEIFLYKTDPTKYDTDLDGLSDYEEIFMTHTDPLVSDSDGNGTDDLDETYTIIKTYADDDTNIVTPTLSIDLKGTDINALHINKIPEDDAWMSSDIPGYIGNAFDFNVDEVFSEATITFEYDDSLNSINNFEPKIYYFNKEENVLEELPNQIKDGNKVSSSVTHFSEYILLNKTDFDATTQEALPEGVIKSPKEIIILLDFRGFSENVRLKGVNTEVSKLIIEKLNYGNEIKIMKIKDKSTVEVLDFTKNKESLIKALDDLSSENYNGILDLPSALNIALDGFKSNDSDLTKRQMIFITDGESYSIANNRPSIIADYNRALNKAKSINVSINVICTTSKPDGVVYGVSEETNGLYSAISKDIDYGQTSASDKFSDKINTLAGIENIDKSIDADNDGICDYYETMINLGHIKDGMHRKLNGQLDINKDDTDDDGLLDSEELIIIEKGTNVSFRLDSNPTMADSDGDGFTDKLDPRPFVTIIKRENVFPVYVKNLDENLVFNKTSSFENPPNAPSVEKYYNFRKDKFNTIEPDDADLLQYIKSLTVLNYFAPNPIIKGRIISTIAMATENDDIDIEEFSTLLKVMENRAEFIFGNFISTGVTAAVLPNALFGYYNFLLNKDDSFVRGIIVEDLFNTCNKSKEARNVILNEIMEYGEYYFFNNFDENETYISSNNASFISTLKLTDRQQSNFQYLIGGALTNLDWLASLGSTTGTISADISKTDNDNYEMIVKYNVEDFTSGISQDYLATNTDADGNTTMRDMLVTDKEERLWAKNPVEDFLTTRFHYAGLAKDHKVKGEIQITVKWKRGERLTGYKNKMDDKVTVEY